LTAFWAATRRSFAAPCASPCRGAGQSAGCRSLSSLSRWTAGGGARGSGAPLTLRPRSGPVAKAYRLLSRVMTTAADEGLIGRSPCVIKGAGTEHLPEMKSATVDQVAELSDAVGPQHRALVLLAALGGLRWGELAGLRRRRVRPPARAVAVAEILTGVNGKLDIGSPKTDAGQRRGALRVPGRRAGQPHGTTGRTRTEGSVFPTVEGGPCAGRTSVAARGRPQRGASVCLASASTI
jgi:integrase